MKARMNEGTREKVIENMEKVFEDSPNKKGSYEYVIYKNGDVEGYNNRCNDKPKGYDEFKGGENNGIAYIATNREIKRFIKHNEGGYTIKDYAEYFMISLEGVLPKIKEGKYDNWEFEKVGANIALSLHDILR